MAIGHYLKMANLTPLPQGLLQATNIVSLHLSTRGGWEIVPELEMAFHDRHYLRSPRQVDNDRAPDDVVLLVVLRWRGQPQPVLRKAWEPLPGASLAPATVADRERAAKRSVVRSTRLSVLP
jgi:hypothetical protein